MWQLIPGIGEKLSGLLDRKYGTPDTLDRMREILATISDLPLITQQYIKYNPIRIIPRTLIRYIEQDFRTILPDVQFDFAGSYRRERPYSGDIDIVLVGDPDECLEKIGLSPDYNVVEAYSQGPDKLSCFLHIRYLSTRTFECYVKVDFFVTNPEEYAYMLFYATGSKAFNIRMRVLARKRGLKLNQRGLFDSSGNPHPAKTEEEILRILDQEYVGPEDRET